MKRVIYLIISILALPLVSAEDIMIGGKAYPLIIILPMLLVFVVWAILLVSYLKNNFHKISLMVYNLRRYLRKIGLGKVSDALKNIKLPKKPIEAEKKQLTKDLSMHVDNLSKFENQLPRMKPEEGFLAFNELVRKFFADLLGMHYEFTDEELIAELQKSNRGLVKFASRMAYIKYSGRSATKDEIIDLLDEYKYIVESSAKKFRGNATMAVKYNAITKVIEEDKRIFENVREYLGFLKNENRKRHIEHLLHEERVALKSNIKSMKNTYNRILNMYIQLTPQERAQIYPELMEFYNDVNKAIFSSVYGEAGKRHLLAMQKELLRISKLPKKMSIAEKIRKGIDQLFPKKVAVVPAPLAPVKMAHKVHERNESIFTAIKSFFKVDAKAKHRLLKGDDLKMAHKLPKSLADLKREEDESIGKIRNIIKEDKEARKNHEEIAKELSGRRKERASLKKSRVPLPMQQKQEPLSALRKQPEERPGLFSGIFVKKKEEQVKPTIIAKPKPFIIEEKPKEIKARPIVAPVNKRGEEEKELLKKIDDMVKESVREKRRENELKDRIAEAQQLVRQGKLNAAKRNYERMKPIFYSLPNDSQKAVYPLLTSLQRQIAALELKAKEDTEHSLEKEERMLLEKMKRLRG